MIFCTGWNECARMDATSKKRKLRVLLQAGAPQTPAIARTGESNSLLAASAVACCGGGHSEVGGDGGGFFRDEHGVHPPAGAGPQHHAGRHRTASCVYAILLWQ